MYSSPIPPRTNLNCGILTAAIIFSHSTDNCSHEVFFNSHLTRLPPTKNSPITTPERASVSPINPWSETRETRAFLLLRHCGNTWRHCWRGHVTPPLSCLIKVFIAVVWQQARRGEARRGRRLSRNGRARLGTEKTPLRLLLRNRGNVFQCYSSCMV
jgi:hypothetical protein